MPAILYWFCFSAFFPLHTACRIQISALLSLSSSFSSSHCLVIQGIHTKEDCGRVREKWLWWVIVSASRDSKIFTHCHWASQEFQNQPTKASHLLISNSVTSLSIVVKTMGYQHKVRYLYQRRESPEIHSYIYGQPIFNMYQEHVPGTQDEKWYSPTNTVNGAGKPEYPYHIYKKLKINE